MSILRDQRESAPQSSAQWNGFKSPLQVRSCVYFCVCVLVSGAHTNLCPCAFPPPPDTIASVYTNNAPLFCSVRVRLCEHVLQSACSDTGMKSKSTSPSANARVFQGSSVCVSACLSVRVRVFMSVCVRVCLHARVLICAYHCMYMHARTCI